MTSPHEPRPVDLHGRQLHAAVAHRRLRARYRAVGGAGLRSDGRRLLRRVQAAQLVPPPVRRRRLLGRLRAAVRARAAGRWPRRRAGLRAPGACRACCSILVPFSLLHDAGHAGRDLACWRPACATSRSSPWPSSFGRITFPYLVFISLASLYGGVLNSIDRFADVAFTPILLNLALIGSCWA